MSDDGAPAKADPKQARHRLALVAPIIPFIVVVVVASRMYGAWVIAAGFLAAGMIAMWLAARAEARQHQSLRRRFAERESITLDQQARSLLTQRGLEPSVPSTLAVVTCWKDVGRILGIEPTKLRPDDDLVRDLSDPFSSLTESNAERLRDQVNWHGNPKSPVSLPHERCRHCNYDLRGLEPDARCPECGHERIPIRTLGDYLLFVSGVLRSQGDAPKRP